MESNVILLNIKTLKWINRSRNIDKSIMISTRICGAAVGKYKINDFRYRNSIPLISSSTSDILVVKV